MSQLNDSDYRDFWGDVGAEFPDLSEAVSTAYYRSNEQRLLREFLPTLEGLRVFKTDLWDEARNTRILCWASEQGAKAYGIDLSPPTVQMASEYFSDRSQRLGGVVSDVRWIPYASDTFDVIYSMGTIEHFDETEDAVAEIARVLKPGGTAIIGVPNRHDPFLRPLMVAILYRIGLYGYGFEKSYSRKALRRMLKAKGLQVTAETGVLFIPGWLRMLDLAFHAWARPLAWATGLAVQPFAWLYDRFPALRKHGYLIAAIATKS